MGTWGFAGLLTGVAAGTFAVVRTTLLVGRLQGESMEPAYHDGDIVLMVRRLPGVTIRCGDVVMFRPLHETPRRAKLLLKRVVAVAGDPMPAVDEPTTVSTVPPGHVFVRGDNPRSYDSRQFGPVPLDHVVSYVVTTLPRWQTTPALQVE